MDDLIGTQAPPRRLEDRAEALAAFQHASPELAALQRPEPAAIDWSYVEGRLATSLPPDFKLLAERYPDLTIGGTLYVGFPQPGAEYGWVDGTLEELEIVEEWCEDAGLEPPVRAFPHPGGLLSWGGTDWGDILLWTTREAAADWTVTVATRGGGWWHYDGGLVQFLTGLVDGSVDQWGLHKIKPEVTGGHPSSD